MPDYGPIIAKQSVQSLTTFVAARIRQPKAIKTDDLPLADRPALKAAERLVATGAPAEGESTIEIVNGPMLFPDGLFSAIEDREPAKLVLERAIRSPRPVHVLLEGEPASGKSQLLMACLTMPGTRYAVGGMTTSSGLVDFLLEKRTTQLVLIDELDKADPADYAALYSLMESGQVPRLQHGKTEVLHWRGRIFAAANSTAKIPDALLSRFVIVQCPPYSPEQVRAINRKIGEREGLSAKRSAQLADAAAARSSDPRDARDLARLAGEDGEIDGLLEHLGRPKAGKTR